MPSFHVLNDFERHSNPFRNFQASSARAAAPQFHQSAALSTISGQVSESSSQILKDLKARHGKATNPNALIAAKSLTRLDLASKMESASRISRQRLLRLRLIGLATTVFYLTRGVLRGLTGNDGVFARLKSGSETQILFSRT